MPKVTNVPAALRPYLFHGLELSWEGREQALGECPWCGKGRGKFSVSVDEGLWSCKSCQAGSAEGGGNIYTFLRELWERSDSSEAALEELARHRGLKASTLAAWGACVSVLTGEWLVPGYGIEGNLAQLYRYVPSSLDPRKWLLLATPGLTHQLFGLPLFDTRKEKTYLCEGPWDGMALWETLGGTKEEDGGYSSTGNPVASLLSGANVLAVPGCSGFADRFAPLFAGKEVVLLYDNDHPRQQDGREVPPAGYMGCQHTTGLLGRAEPPPARISYLCWGPGGYDRGLPSGADVRDILGKEGRKGLDTLFARVVPTPAEWWSGVPRVGGRALQPKVCHTWRELRQSWLKALHWTEGLDRALAVMLAAVASTEMVGDQLWIMVLGPPACGKSTLCEAVSVATKYVVAKSSLRGFYSGYQTDREGSEDHSLVARLRSKALVVKDGDTILQLPNRDQLMAQARDLYDTTARSHWNNRMSRDYTGVRFPWILCGTNGMRQLDASELGERFLTCNVMESIDEDLENDILRRVAIRAEESVNHVADGKAETQYEPKLAAAMGLTGGYVEWLRENVARLLPRVVMVPRALDRCVRLGKFVAYLRARPSQKQEEVAERELASRLVSQLVRLAKCLAVVVNKALVDAEVLAQVRQIALDTARGRTFDLCQQLARVGEDGLEAKALALLTGEDDRKLRPYLLYLRKIGVVEVWEKRVTSGYKLPLRWRMTAVVAKLWEEVAGAPRR